MAQSSLSFRFGRSGFGRLILLGVGTPLLAITLGFSGCEKEEPEAAPSPPEVKVVIVEQRDVPIYQEWVGSSQGDVDATISAQVSGYLTKREYREGAQVAKDQVLFQIDPAPFEAALARANAQLVQAQAHKGKTALDVKRYRPLAASQAISQQELDDAIQADEAAGGQVAGAQAAVLEAELTLQFTTIRSPVDGVAGLAQAHIGDLVGPSTGPLTTVAKIDPIRVNFYVSQVFATGFQMRQLAAGQKLRATGEGPELQLTLASGYVYPHSGRVRFADNQVDPRTGSIQVVGEFPNPEMLLVPGMFATVRALIGTEKDALLVPQEAVVETQGRYLIAVVGDDNKVSVRPVAAGERVGGDWVVAGNLKAGDRVVAEGVQKVRDGAVVVPSPMEAPVATQPAVDEAEATQ
jgi:membrane fusion protein, multidrug efflux system